MKQPPLLPLAAVLVSLAPSARAQPTSPPSSPPPSTAPPHASAPPADASPSEDAKTTARAHFATGFAHVKKFQWAEALSAFERSAEIVPNAVTSLNIGLCERALGRYVRARRSLLRAVSEDAAAGGAVLSESSRADITGYLREFDEVLAKAKITVRPADAVMTVDGRPLAPLTTEPGATLAAGLAPPGKGTALPAETVEVILDPGNHVFVLGRKGFSDVIVNRTLAPGERATLNFELEKLPATLKVTSSVAGAIVRVGAVDVGPVPVDVRRAAGSYPVRVVKEGYVDYETSLTVKPGEEAKINAVLVEESFDIAEQWWFWVSIAGALGTAATVTYFAVRPEPEPPPYEGGSSGWVVRPAGIRF